MTTIVLVTRNPGKLLEIRKLMPDSYVLKTLEDIGFTEEIEESGVSFRENALLKARFIHDRLKVNTLADDSGLEVEALGGEPGIFSARYTGKGSTDSQNISKLLDQLKHFTNRKARFVTSIALILDGKHHFFDGEVNGEIASEPSGKGGFGYDPVFIPTGYDHTFAVLPAEIKNRVSHRAEAMKKLKLFLENRLSS